MNHADLVERAARWLQGTVRCGVVSTANYNVGQSIPDAIGWTSSKSYLVECKASRGDFRRDLKKFHRQYAEHGMGNVRYYLTPPGLLLPDELPEHWGLLEARPTQVRVVKDADCFLTPKVARNERGLLCKLLKQAREENAALRIVAVEEAT